VLQEESIIVHISKGIIIFFITGDFYLRNGDLQNLLKMRIKITLHSWLDLLTAFLSTRLIGLVST